MAEIKIQEKFRSFSDECVSEKGPFKELAELACFCAHYAYSKGGKIKEAKLTPTDRSIRDLVLDNTHYKEQIDMLALAVTQDYKILMESQDVKAKRYKIFQNYVNFGLKLLYEKNKKNVSDTSGINTVLEVLIDQASKNRKVEPESEIDVDTEF